MAAADDKLPDRVRAWCFTAYFLETQIDLSEPGRYNLDLSAIEEHKDYHFTHLLAQLERCPKTLKLHLQGVCHFKHPLGLKAAQNRIYKALPCVHPKVHVEKCRNYEASIEYCSKWDSRVAGPFEYGAPPEQGKRTDIQVVSDMVLTNVSLTEIARAHPTTFIRYHRGIEALRSTLSVPRLTGPSSVLMVFGDTGRGKTTSIALRYRCEHIFWVMPQLQVKWWDGYDPAVHSVVVFDDVSPNFMSDAIFKRLTDRRAGCRVQTKGGSVEFKSDIVLITSNYSLDDLFPTVPEASLAAIRRRVTQIALPPPPVFITSAAFPPCPTCPQHEDSGSDTEDVDDKEDMEEED